MSNWMTKHLAQQAIKDLKKGTADLEQRRRAKKRSNFLRIEMEKGLTLDEAILSWEKQNTQTQSES